MLNPNLFFFPEVYYIHECFEFLSLHMLCVFMVMGCDVKGNTNFEFSASLFFLLTFFFYSPISYL